mgnify:CR=1 FL=1|tara:strand:- start:3034 stop:3462 length:429 start_codon:yes stop_codon:yes gene_type:complete
MSKVKTLKVEKAVTTTGTQEISNRDLLTISQGLAYINSKESKVWHTITKNLDSIQKEVDIINIEHKRLTDDLATKDDTGTPVKTEQNQIEFGENIEEANTRWNTVLDQRVNVTLYTINLEDVKDLNLDANIMKPLLGLVVVE